MERKSTREVAARRDGERQARPKAMFCFSNRMPRPMATTPSTRVVILETRSSSASLALPSLDDAGIEVVRDRGRPRQGQPGHDRQYGGKRHGGDEARNRLPPTASARWTAAMLVPPAGRRWHP